MKAHKSVLRYVRVSKGFFGASARPEADCHGFFDNCHRAWGDDHGICGGAARGVTPVRQGSCAAWS